VDQLDPWVVGGNAEQEYPSAPDMGIDDGQRLPLLVQQLGRDQQRPHTATAKNPTSDRSTVDTPAVTAERRTRVNLSTLLTSISPRTRSRSPTTVAAQVSSSTSQRCNLSISSSRTHHNPGEQAGTPEQGQGQGGPAASASAVRRARRA